MNDLSRTRPATRLGLVAYLNDELRRLERSKPRRCGCRVTNISPRDNSPGSPWQAEFLGNRCAPDCLGLVQGIIDELHCKIDVAW